MKKNKNLDDLIEKLEFVDVDINATHLNYVNGNSLLYTIDAANSGGKSWITPYKKPQLLHHDKHSDAVGRIMGYSIEDTAATKGEPNDFIKLQVRITDKEAISKVIKGIYYTCSVGSSTSRVRCSHCDQVLTVDGLCEHEKGSTVDGEKVHWIVDNISYRENSFVNNPADSYSRIVSIDIGDGPMAYDKFLDDKEELLTNFYMEDGMTKKAKLTKESRQTLPESAFCGPNRSFPAHDEEHVAAGLKLLDSSDFDDSTIAKIKSSLYRKGKRFDIEPQEDELLKTKDLLVFRMDDEFTDEEVKAITTFFDENPDADLPSEDEATEEIVEDEEKVTYTIDDYQEVVKGKKDEIIKFCDFIVTKYNELNDTITKINDEKSELTDKVSEQDTILISKEDEINKLLDDNAQLTVNYKHALVDNILDFKKVTENKDEEFNKYDSRKVESLVDTLSDFRNESENSIPKVNDETLKDSSESDNDSTSDETTIIEDSNDDSKQSKIDRFFKNNILTMEE